MQPAFGQRSQIRQAYLRSISRRRAVMASRVLNLSSATVRGAQGLTVSASGRVPLAGSGMDVRINGSAPLGLANRFLAERGAEVSGTLRLDASISGSIRQPAIHGTFSTAGAGFVDPQSNVRLRDIAVTANIDGETVTDPQRLSRHCIWRRDRSNRHDLHQRCRWLPGQHQDHAEPGALCRWQSRRRDTERQPGHDRTPHPRSAAVRNHRRRAGGNHCARARWAAEPQQSTSSISAPPRDVLATLKRARAS